MKDIPKPHNILGKLKYLSRSRFYVEYQIHEFYFSFIFKAILLLFGNESFKKYFKNSAFLS